MEPQHKYGLAVILVVSFCYYNALDCGFVFDDMSAIVENKDLRPRVPLQNLFWNDFWGTPMHMEKSHKSYRPLCVLTFRLNYALSELEPMTYHLVNVVLHAVVCLLYMKVCNMFLKEFTSFIATMMFAVHPVHTEAITGVVGRAEALSSIFFLAALISYAKCSDHSKTRWFYLIITVTLVTIAMLCKEQGITVIGVCCVYEVFVAQRATFAECLHILGSFVRGKPCVPEWLKSSVIRAVFLVGTTLFLLFARIKVMGAQLPVFTRFDNPASMESTPARQLTFNYLLPINMWLLLCPSGLCCDWTMGTIPVISSLFDFRNLATLLFFISIGYVIGCMLQGQNRRNRAIIMSLSFLIIPFIPASNLFFPVGFVVAERILYTPSMGFTMLVALGFELIMEKKEKLRPLIIGMLGILLLTHGTKTFMRNYDWKSEYSIFRAALKVNNRNAKLFNNVGHALEKIPKFDEALEYFQRAASVQPDDIGAHINVGRTYNNLNMSAEAEAAYRKAMELFPPVLPGKSYTARIAPNHLNVFLNLASLVSKDPNRILEAEQLLKKAVSMRPDYVQGYINRGDIMVKLGRPLDALDEYKLALRYDPDNADVYYNIGVVSLDLGKTKEARQSFEKAIEVDPNHVQSLYNSAIMIHESEDVKKWPEALKRDAITQMCGGYRLHVNKLINLIKAVEKSLLPSSDGSEVKLQRLQKIDPKDAKVYFTLGMIRMDLKDYATAEKDFKNCLKHDPVFRSALFNLALLLNNYMNSPLESIPYLDTLLTNYPDHTKGLMLMGDINVNTLKNLDAAERNFETVIQQEPKNIQAHHNLCVVYVERGDLFRAEKCLTKVHNMAPEEQYIINHLNIVRTKLNEAIKKRREQQAEKSQQNQNSPQSQNPQQSQAKRP